MKKNQNHPRVKSKLTWLPAKTFELEFIIPWEKVKTSYQKNLKKLTEKTTIKGFRKGKAPQEVVAKQLDQTQLYTLVLEELLPQTYFAAVQQHQLKPICEPKITPLKTNEGADWHFKATACEAPQVKLGNYEQVVKNLKLKTQIWLPGQDKTSTKEEKGETESLEKIFQGLLETCQVEISPILTESEEKRLLSNLLEEIQKLGLTLNEYCTNNHKTLEQLKAEYHKLAQETLKLEFILQAIAQEKKLTVEEKEITDLIATIPEEKTRKNLSTPLQKAYIKSLLSKRKAIDFLMKL